MGRVPQKHPSSLAAVVIKTPSQRFPLCSPTATTKFKQTFFAHVPQPVKSRACFHSPREGRGHISTLFFRGKKLPYILLLFCPSSVCFLALVAAVVGRASSKYSQTHLFCMEKMDLSTQWLWAMYFYPFRLEGALLNLKSRNGRGNLPFPAGWIIWQLGGRSGGGWKKEVIYFGEVDLLCAMQERIGRRGGGKETAILFLSGMEGGQRDVVVWYAGFSFLRQIDFPILPYVKLGVYYGQYTDSMHFGKEWTRYRPPEGVILRRFCSLLFSRESQMLVPGTYRGS